MLPEGKPAHNLHLHAFVLDHTYPNRDGPHTTFFGAIYTECRCDRFRHLRVPPGDVGMACTAHSSGHNLLFPRRDAHAAAFYKSDKPAG